MAKGLNYKEGIDCKETYSHVSKKDLFYIIIALVAHFNLELYQINVKTTFLNGSLSKDVCMVQLDGYLESGEGNLVQKLKRSIYGLKQASKQWYLKFHDIVTSYGVNGSKCIILLFYVDNILLAANNIDLLLETKNHMFSNNFDMKDLGTANYVLRIQILCDRSRGIQD